MLATIGDVIWNMLNMQHIIPNSKLEQLEHLRSENTLCCPMITHTIDSYWIPSPNKTKSKLQILPKIKILQKALNATQTDRRTDGQRETSISPFHFAGDYLHIPTGGT